MTAFIHIKGHSFNVDAIQAVVPHNKGICDVHLANGDQVKTPADAEAISELIHKALQKEAP